MKKYITQTSLILILFLFFSFVGHSQSGINTFLKPSDTLNIQRRNAVIVAETVFYVGGLACLNKGFDYKFHIDHAYNLQMDKAAHVFASYQIGNLFFNSLKWSGVSEKNQLIYGAGMGFITLTSIEFLEGYGKYGASYKDMIANGIGTSLFVTQELLWHEQRIVTKLSFNHSDFLSSSPSQMKSQIMNEFDDQTVWLSINIHSFLKKSKIPKWLNVAVGYGVENVSSKHYITIDNITQKAAPYRQFYLSFDADLTKIETKSHFLKTFFAVFNSIKIPAPTIEYSVNEGFRGRILYF